MKHDFKIPIEGVIVGNQRCQTGDAKWLCLENVFPKFYRPHLYNIGGTYIADTPQFWFFYKVESVGKLYLFHLFVHTGHGTSFKISVSSSSEISFKRDNNLAFFSSALKTFIINEPDMPHKYITTYSFSEVDVAILRNINLYIPIAFEKDTKFTSTININHDFGALLQDDYGADFIIESADCEKIKVHKIFLSAHSEVFRAMLKENTAESQNKYMKMFDVDKDDLKCILEFIYTGTIKNIECCNFYNLLMFGDKYNMNGLKRLSESALASQLSIDNVIETIAAADIYNADNLKLSALKFLKYNNAAIHNSFFQELLNLELVKEICQFLVPC